MNSITTHERAATAMPEDGKMIAPREPQQAFSLAPRDLDQAFKLADLLAESELVPKDFRNKPGNCLIAIQWGSEIGLKPLQALQNIAVINGRPCLWGDALIALVRSSPLCEYVLEGMEGSVAVCRVKRRGEPEQIRTFSDADAKTAGLLGKQGPWQTNPARMKQMRARAFALRDVFPDVLKGIAVAEEVMDYVDIPAVPAKPITHAPVIEVPADLLKAARAAAEGGRDVFAAWWKAATPTDRGMLRNEVADLKDRTEAADAARTVDNNPVADPVDPAFVDPFVDALNKAEQEGGAN